MRRRFLGNPVFDYTRYMTIESLEDGLFIQVPSAVEYTIDGTWKKLEANDSIEVNKGQFVSFKKTYVTGLNFGTFIINGRCNLRGNCMSMIFGDSGYKNNYLSGLYQPFHSMFKNCTGIVSVEPTFLPATTLADHCYDSMFYGCTSLTTAPELPATALASNCYFRMFYGCTSLTTAPELPATTLAKSCYSGMFQNCTSVTTAPELPATALDYNCYSGMFQNCTSVTTAPELPATALDYNCYSGMFSYCTSLTTAPELPATTLASNCYDSMFSYCTSLTTAPELPATALASNCYFRMFYGCTKLNYIKMLATDISASSCLYYWVYAVASSGTFVKHPDMNSLPTGDSGIPEGWTVVNDGEESGGSLEFPITLSQLTGTITEYPEVAEYLLNSYNVPVGYTATDDMVNIVDDIYVETLRGNVDGKVIAISKSDDGNSLFLWTEKAINDIEVARLVAPSYYLGVVAWD